MLKTIKNVSRKVIGNKEFMLLPGGTMEVTGTELWVKMYLAAGVVEEVTAPQAVPVETKDADLEVDEEPGPDEAPETEKTPESSDTVAKKEDRLCQHRQME